MSTKLSIPRPTRAHLPQVTRLRPLIPLISPTLPTKLPALPSPPRTESPLGSPWTLSTHILPTAFPRSISVVPAPPPIADDEQDRKGAAARLVEKMLTNAREHAAHPPPPEERNTALMWNCVNRYARKRASGETPTRPITLFLAHANGFHKETWEPTLRALVKHLEDSKGVDVDEIWSWEAANHGDAALLNSTHLGGVFDWSDATRDILNFLLNYLPSRPSTSTLPVHLPRVTESEASARQTRGLADRTLVAVAHSLGGCTTALAAYHTPALFDSIILVDPPLEHASRYTADGYMLGAVKRRDWWPSRDAARAQFSTSSFFGAWAPAVLDSYIEYALGAAEKGGVKLKTPSIQEAAVFADYCTPPEVYDCLKDIDPRIALHWIVPAQASKQFARDPEIASEAMQMRVWRRMDNASNVCIEGSGHLIVQEAPEKLAREVFDFLKTRYAPQIAKL